MFVILSRCARREEKRPKDDGDSQQINGREGETATLLWTVFGELKVACRRFRPTSSQPFGGYRL
jgi:CRISPR/Cas system-associated endonuclease Cas1